MRRIWGRLLTSVIMVGALVTTIASPAFAGQNASVYCGLTKSDSVGTWNNCGYAQFLSNSIYGVGEELLVVTDLNDDGWSAAVQNYRYDMADPGPYLGIAGGINTDREYRLHMPEGTKIKFRVCPYKVNAGLYTSLCGPWVTGVA